MSAIADTPTIALRAPGRARPASALLTLAKRRASLTSKTPRQLVEALQARAAGARAQLDQLLRSPLRALMAQFLARHGLDEDCDLLTLHAIHAEAVTTRKPTLDDVYLQLTGARIGEAA